MAKVSTSISLDADVKAKAQELFADFGLDLSTAINIFLRQSIRENGHPLSDSKGCTQRRHDSRHERSGGNGEKSREL